MKLVARLRVPNRGAPGRVAMVGVLLFPLVLAQGWWVERVHAQACIPDWSDQFLGNEDLDGPVSALAAFDDDGAGSNPVALFVGGRFTIAGSAGAGRVAKWTGAAWQPLGEGVNERVNALAVFDVDGGGPGLPALYAGGDFTMAGGAAANRIARWNGSSWAPLGSGLDGEVFALAVFDPDGAGAQPAGLYAGGAFMMAGGMASARVARWNGTSWAPLGAGTDGSVLALAVVDLDGGGPGAASLFAGGSFGMAGGLVAQRIARWDGVNWNSVGGGVDGNVRALASFDVDAGGPMPPALFAGGDFTFAGAMVLVNRVVRWNGATWSALGAGTDGPVSALGVFDSDAGGPATAALYAAGTFGSPGTNAASWNGVSWTGVPTGGTTVGPISSLVVVPNGGPPSSGKLFAGGDFAAPGVPGVSHVAELDAAGWAPLDDGISATNGLGDEANAVAVFDADGNGPNPAQLLVGGIASAGDVSVNGIAGWNGEGWSNFGSGQLGATALSVFDADGAGPANPVLYGGGGFTSGASTTIRVATWNGVTWTPVGGNFTGTLAPSISAVRVHDPDGAGGAAPIVYAAGTFTHVGGTLVRHIARHDGVAWSSLAGGITAGLGFFPGVFALALFDDDGPGPNPTDLYAGGNFTTIGGLNTSCVARWNGVNWVSLAGGVSSTVYALAVFDADGAGPGLPALFAGGDFTSAGGMATNRIARWNPGAPGSWSALGSGIGGANVLALATFDVDGTGPQPTSLYAGGEFSQAGGVAANSIARWDGSVWSPLGSGIVSSFGAAVNLLTVFDDDGPGPTLPALYAFGFFSNAGGNPSARIARWGCDTDAPVPGDGDGDGDVDLDDLASIGDCLTGPNNGPVGPGCEAFDFEPDDDVDLDDAAAFQNAFTG